MALVPTANLVAGARSGRLVSFPTDTVPALAALPSHAAAIFTLKQRSPDKPLILMAATLPELLAFIDMTAPEARQWCDVAARYFPGALTLVLPANAAGRELNPGRNSLGIRIPDCPTAIGILQQTGPLLTTSANHSGAAPLRRLREIAATFPQVMTLGDGDRDAITGSGFPSTVLEWSDSTWRLRRQGQVTVEL